MKPGVLTAVSAWFSLLVPSQACGPFFPDTVLDKPQAALAAPPVSYLHNLYRLAGKPTPRPPDPYDPNRVDQPDESPFVRQIPLETAELRALWEKEGVAPDQIQERIHDYESVRRLLLAPLLEESSAMSFPTHSDHPPGLPVRPLGPEFPQDVADYVEAARLHAIGDTAAARTLWKGILDRPPAERRLRAAWAAWMLAKTSPDLDECLSWYERIETEIDSGASDAIGLGGAAKSWRAGFALQPGKMKDPVKMTRFLYEAFVSGKEFAAIDLRRMSGIVLLSDDETLRAAAADPIVRRLINLELHSSYDGSTWMITAPQPADDRGAPLLRWLAAIEAAAPPDLDDMSRVAWALYSAGSYGDALKVLAVCPKDDPLALWLQAKFDLRDGKLDQANEHLAASIRLQSKMAGWNPVNPADDGGLWFADSAMIDSKNQARLLADSGIISLALKDYLAALESLRKGGYEQDAAYLAENVVDLDGLIRHVRRVAPQWTPVKNPAGEEETSTETDTRLTGTRFSSYGIGIDNQLRYQLARRLARERRFREAREFMPPVLCPALDRYVKLDKARTSGRYSGSALAAITWNQARMHRELGSTLFGTDSAPDGGALGYYFPSTRFHEGRVLRAGWKRDWSEGPAYVAGTKPEEKAVPQVTTDEVARIRKNSATPMMRYHYRYTAADLAWEAAKSLPPNHPHLAPMYNTAGQWISLRDPKAADRFYQAMVRRCSKTGEGKAADEKRWFLTDVNELEDLPLPAPLQLPQTTATP